MRKLSEWKLLSLFAVLTVCSLLYCWQHVLVSDSTTLVIDRDHLVTKNSGDKYDEEEAKKERIKNLSPTQKQRVNHLRNYCKVNRQNGAKSVMLKFARNHFREKERKGHIFVGRKTNVLYCAVPKVASTNWKRMLLLFDGAKANLSEMKIKSKVHTLPELKPLYDVKENKIRKVLQTNYKFLFVRHPFERLASAFRNKFADNNTYFEKTYGSRILRMNRKHLTRQQYTDGKGVTFKEFVRWMIEKEPYDPHWIPVHQLCHPCIIKYNFIGKMETLLSDSEEVIRNVGSSLEFPMTWTDGYRVSSNELMHSYFSKLTDEEIEKIFHYYRKDFEAFDYNMPSAFNQTLASIKFLKVLKRLLNSNY